MASFVLNQLQKYIFQDFILCEGNVQRGWEIICEHISNTYHVVVIHDASLIQRRIVFSKEEALCCCSQWASMLTDPRIAMAI